MTSFPDAADPVEAARGVVCLHATDPSSVYLSAWARLLEPTVEAVESTTVAAPRLSGPSSTSLVITRLVKAGTIVRPGDVLVEFDRQAQLAAALRA